jgi:hypothetical protein
MKNQDLFWNLYTYTPWDKKAANVISNIHLMSILKVFDKYPLIGSRFFDDIKLNIKNHSHYSFYKTIKRIINPQQKDYKIQAWNFIWAMDKKKRMYQFLFQKVKKDKKIMAVLVALAPMELVKLFSTHRKEGILKTLSLLTNPENMSFLTLLYPQGKSMAEESQKFNVADKNLDKIRFSNYLKQQPNVQGQWFPTFSPKCPVCGSIMKELDGYRVGFKRLKLVCPKCGYEKNK